MNENVEIAKNEVVREDLSVWEQIAVLKGIEYGEKYW